MELLTLWTKFQLIKKFYRWKPLNTFLGRLYAAGNLKSTNEYDQDIIWKK